MESPVLRQMKRFYFILFVLGLMLIDKPAKKTLTSPAKRGPMQKEIKKYALHVLPYFILPKKAKPFPF
jgi:hypothetical protein